jgi:CheY-like chemotaxis protein
MPCEKSRLLVVDDKPLIRTSISYLLSEMGYSVRGAQDGFSALRELREEVPDILLSDLNMPGMCGYEAPSRWIRALLKSLGPGIITGAADDDPSGIATYSIAGAQLGTKLLWTALLTWPLMAAVQMMCARIGKVTGQGLAGNFKQRFPKWLLLVFVIALLAANTINIAADLAGMADAASMLSGDQFPLVCGGVRASYLVGNGPAPVSADRKRAQVAGSGSFRVSPLLRLWWEPIGARCCAIP